MLSPKSTNCSTCSDIDALVNDIDCKLFNLANSLYGNITYALNLPVPYTVIIDLLHYKRILQYKSVNPDYASCYTVDQIASRVKILKFK